MRKLKITISFEKGFHEEIEELADKMRVSKSQLLEMAAREFVQSHKGEKSLESPDTASEDLSEIEIEPVEIEAHSEGSKLIDS